MDLLTQKSGERTARGGSADTIKDCERWICRHDNSGVRNGSADMKKVERTARGGSADTTKVERGLREVDLLTRQKWRQWM